MTVLFNDGPRRLLGLCVTLAMLMVGTPSHALTDGEALAPAQQMLERTERQFGPDHPTTLVSMFYLAHVYMALNRYGEAEPLLLRAMTGQELALGPEDPSTLLSAQSLANLYIAQSRYTAAEPLLLRAVRGLENV